MYDPLTRQRYREHLALVRVEVSRLTEHYEQKLRDLQDSYELEISNLKETHELTVKKLKMQARAIFESHKAEVAKHTQEHIVPEGMIKSEVLSAMALYANLRLENHNSGGTAHRGPPSPFSSLN